MSSSAEEKFLRDWEAKFPFVDVPEDLEFLRHPKDAEVLERSLDRCTARADELNAEIARLDFISGFILQLMDSAKDEQDRTDAAAAAPTAAAAARHPVAAAGDEEPMNRYREDENASSFVMVNYDDAPRTHSFDFPMPKKRGGMRNFLGKVKGTAVAHASSESNIYDSCVDKSPGKSKGQSGGGAVEALASTSSRSYAGVIERSSVSCSTAPRGEDDTAKNGQTEDSCFGQGSRMERESANERRHSSGNMLDDVVAKDDSYDLESSKHVPKRNRPRPQRTDLYEEAIPFARPLGSDLDDRVLSDDEHEEENNPIYYNILLLKQQTLDRAKMVYFNEEPSSKLERQARKLSMRYNQFNRRAGCKSEHFGALDPVAQRHNRQSMMAISGISEGQSDVDEIDAFVAPLCAEEEKLQVRRALVTSIVESEQDYIDVLDSLLQYMQTFKNLVDTAQSVLSLADIDSIFLKIPDLHRIHYIFIHGLRPKVEKWSNGQEVAEIFHQLAEEEYRIAPVYLKNYQKAISTVKRCHQENQQFRTLTKDIHVKGMDTVGSLEELLHKPVVRIQRNTLVLQDLINCTPPGHPDYDLLQKTHSLAQKFLNNFENPSRKTVIDYQRYVVKNDVVVERVNNARKLRHIFLFNDIFVCARRKVTTRQRLTFEVEWCIPLVDLVVSSSDVESGECKKAETEPIRKKVVSLQNDLKVEMKRAKASGELERNWSLKMHTKNVEKIKKKLLEQKGLLILESPDLPLIVSSKKYNRPYCLLLSSDYERTSWNSAMQCLLSKGVQSPVNLSTQDLNNMLNAIRLPKITSVGSLFRQDDFYLEEEFLFGSLTITIRNLEGLKQPLNTYCCIEVDSFGHFLMQAKTKVISNSCNPNWEEDFDIDLEGAQTLRILCYSVENGQNRLIGKNAYELANHTLTREGYEEKILINEMSLSVFLIYHSREQTLKRTLSLAREGLFGVRIRAVTRREGSRIPLLVTACVEDIESRGMQDVGIYRVSGLASEIQRLKKSFEKNSRVATSLLKSADINVVTGLLKLYFRELPEALFTDTLYPELVKGLSFSDPEAKEKYLLNVVRKLPEPNYSTATYIMDHLIRVSAFKDTNKMTLQNLATVFGPTLLRPAAKEEEKSSGELLLAGAREALTQVAILQHLLSLRAKSAL